MKKPPLTAGQKQLLREVFKDAQRVGKVLSMRNEDSDEYRADAEIVQSRLNNSFAKAKADPGLEKRPILKRMTRPARQLSR